MIFLLMIIPFVFVLTDIPANITCYMVMPGGRWHVPGVSVQLTDWFVNLPKLTHFFCFQAQSNSSQIRVDIV